MKAHLTETQLNKMSAGKIINESGFTDDGDYMFYHDNDFKYHWNGNEPVDRIGIYQDGYERGSKRVDNLHKNPETGEMEYYDEKGPKQVSITRKEYNRNSPQYGQGKFTLDLNDDPRDDEEDAYTRKGAWYATNDYRRRFDGVAARALSSISAAGGDPPEELSSIADIYSMLIYHLTSLKYSLSRKLSIHPKSIEAILREIKPRFGSKNGKQNLSKDVTSTGDNWYQFLLKNGYESVDKLADICLGISDQYESILDEFKPKVKKALNLWRPFYNVSEQTRGVYNQMYDLLKEIYALEKMLNAPITAANHQGDGMERGTPKPNVGTMADKEYNLNQGIYNATRNTLYGNTKISDISMHESKANKNTMKITEGQLKQLVVESLKKVLKESADEWVESPYPFGDEDNNGVDRVTPGDSLPMGCGNDKPGPDMFNPKYNSQKDLKLNQLRSTIVNTLRNYEQSKQSYKLADVAADLSKRYGVPYENVLSSIVKSYKFHDCHYADDEYDVMSKTKKPLKLKESELRNLIKDAVVGMLNESVDEIWSGNYDADPIFDGRYEYKGVGSEASKERMEKINNKNYISRSDDKFNDHRKEGTSPFNKKGKEFGKLESTVNLKGAQNKYGGHTHQIYNVIRDFAGGRMTPEDFSWYMKYYLETPEQAAAFIKFLHLNGFKTEKI